jgi:hypothetical protein
MKEYKNFSEQEPSIVSDVAAAYEVAYEIAQPQQSFLAPFDMVIPLDENGKPIGTPWEEVLEDIYDDLSKHYGVDLRTL